MSKQHPEEESFKDKILNSLNNSDEGTSKEKRSSNRQGQQNKNSQSKNQRERLNVSQESVGSRRSSGAKDSFQNTKKETTEKKKAPVKKKPKNEKMSNATKPTLSVSADEMQRRKMRQKEDRIVSKIVTVVVLALLVIGGILGFSVYRYVSSSLQPLDPDNKKTVAVEIPSGSSNKQIGEILQEDKVIKSGMVFNYYTKFNNLTGFQAGSYHFSPSMSLDDISKNLQGGGAGTAGADAKLTIPEGVDIDKIGDIIAKDTKIKKSDFLDLMKNEDFFKKMQEKYPDLLTSAAKAKGVRYRLEGYLFPATYDYYKTSSLEDIVTQMIDKTNTVMSAYYDTIKQKNMDVQEVMTLASLVEKEGVTETDRKKIAQVFFNRIAAGMPLQSDISILYALGEHKEKVYNKDLQVDSPYNLYTNTGYGPGPFDSPSEQSIKAVLDPIANNYYYFVADIKTGKVYYAETYEEHLALVEKYVNN
ncbi:endolytic transglycosylase MltG [Enterococcus dispar]|uniref:endolytic transglycosylase MltG n=1 Tax=Enterococcus dispar TaxID=44009 RepID=UPI002890D2A2|nr:endolytic transglycosylase MltG [Enterococcus dispar]MDT2704608.1 endolytic transglycosylase MltG [Enterococcus dispar]